MRYGEFFNEDSEECMRGSIQPESKGKHHRDIREREQRSLQRNQAGRAHAACLHIRAVRGCRAQRKVGLARVKGRRGQEEKVSISRQ